MNFLKSQSHSIRKQISGCLEPEMGQEGMFWGDRSVPKLFMMVVSQLCTLTQIHQATHLKFLWYVKCTSKNAKKKNYNDKRELWITQR